MLAIKTTSEQIFKRLFHVLVTVMPSDIAFRIFNEANDQMTKRKKYFTMATNIIDIWNSRIYV